MLLKCKYVSVVNEVGMKAVVRVALPECRLMEGRKEREDDDKGEWKWMEGRWWTDGGNKTIVAVGRIGNSNKTQMNKLRQKDN